MTESIDTQRFVVEEDESGLRLDVFLSRRQALLSRSQTPRIVAAGHVLLNNKPPKAASRLKPGDEVLLRLPEPADSGVIPENIPLKVVYEDSSLLVIDKPPGLVVHPGAGNRQGTLVNALLYHCHDLSGIGGVLRPGIVHRLDKDTSGLMIVAKSDEIHRTLAEHFEARRVEKHYLALVYGDVMDDEGVIDLPVGRHPVERKKMSTKSRQGNAAMRLAATVLPDLKAGGGIAFVASVAGYRGLPKALCYGPGKAALIHFAEVLHLDLTPRGVGVWVINPGFVATPLTAQNDFAMPALQTPEQAAIATVDGFSTGHFEIHFPKRFTRLMKFFALLPYRWYFPLIRRFTGG